MEGGGFGPRFFYMKNDKWRLLDDAPTHTEYFNYDDDTGQTHTKYVYKQTAQIVDQNKSIQSKDVAKGESKELWHLAQIPPSVIHAWLQEDPPLDIFNKDHKERLLKRLDDPDFKYLRVNTSRIGKKTMHI